MELRVKEQASITDYVQLHAVALDIFCKTQADRAIMVKESAPTAKATIKENVTMVGPERRGVMNRLRGAARRATRSVCSNINAAFFIIFHWDTTAILVYTYNDEITQVQSLTSSPQSLTSDICYIHEIFIMQSNKQGPKMGGEGGRSLTNIHHPSNGSATHMSFSQVFAVKRSPSFMDTLWRYTLLIVKKMAETMGRFWSNHPPGTEGNR